MPVTTIAGRDIHDPSESSLYVISAEGQGLVTRHGYLTLGELGTRP